MKTGQSPISLSRVTGIKKGDVVSLVGGGGKTATMYLLAHELAGQGRRVIVTTTTNIMPPDPPLNYLISNFLILNSNNINYCVGIFLFPIHRPFMMHAKSTRHLSTASFMHAFTLSFMTLHCFLKFLILFCG